MPQNVGRGNPDENEHHGYFCRGGGVLPCYVMSKILKFLSGFSTSSVNNKFPMDFRGTGLRTN